MLVDSRQIEKDSLLQTTVCIIGGGVAGITLSLELLKQGINCCVLESGGLVPDPATQDLYRGDNVGLSYIAADASRSRYLGGSSNCWGGWCAPMEAIDFEKREWVSDSGWPVDLEEMTAYYNRSHSVLKLGPFNYDSSYWEKSIPGKNAKRMASKGLPIRDMVSQFSAPVRLGALYRDVLKDGKKVKVFLHANALHLHTDENGETVQKVTVATLNGNQFQISASVFVLATGGIENARLLLSSNDVQKDGLGNDFDLVGRYFMEHPRLLSGELNFTKPWLGNKIYDIKYNYHNSAIAAHGTCIAAQLSITPEVQKTERLLNSRVSFSSVFPGEGSAGATTLWKCKEAVRKRDFRKINLIKDLYTIVSSPVDVMGYGLTRLYRPKALVKGVKFQIIVEQEPNPLSRIRLVKEKDKLGMQKISVDWKMGENEKKTIDRTLSIIGNTLKEINVAEKVRLDPDIRGNDWPDTLEGAWHHMGTTRMHESPKKGVVDATCRVHNKKNLYMAGSSVFPTAGANFPTITIVALAIRLADHINHTIGQEKIIYSEKVL